MFRFVVEMGEGRGQPGRVPCFRGEEGRTEPPRVAGGM